MGSNRCQGRARIIARQPQAANAGSRTPTPRPKSPLSYSAGPPGPRGLTGRWARAARAETSPNSLTTTATDHNSLGLRLLTARSASDFDSQPRQSTPSQSQRNGGSSPGNGDVGTRCGRTWHGPRCCGKQRARCASLLADPTNRFLHERCHTALPSDHSSQFGPEHQRPPTGQALTPNA